ncbi:MAG: DNA polymerase III subunit gamma/tau, partial [Oceanicaulis sp.]
MTDDAEGQGDVDAPGEGVAAAQDPGPALPGMEAPAAPDPGYQVLARKYRPQTFEDLIGQEPMVRTLTNAFAAGRIAQAYMLTGVRGIGKTT